MEQALWYYVNASSESEKNGPIDVALMRILYTTKLISESTLCWTQGQEAGWIPLRDIEGLLELVMTAEGPPTTEVVEQQRSKKSSRRTSRLNWGRKKSDDVDHHKTSLEDHHSSSSYTLGLQCKRKSTPKVIVDSLPAATAAAVVPVTTIPIEVIEDVKRPCSLSIKCPVPFSNLTSNEAGIIYNTETNELVESSTNSSTSTVDDLVKAGDTEESILACLQERFTKNNIYSWVGSSSSVLVSVNPYNVIPALYYATTNTSLSPHVYSLAKASYEAMTIENGHCNQSIVISGESGSGKTEAAKLVTSYLALESSSSKRIESNNIYDVNLLLESFGNAATSRNDNSSRFGKWTKLIFKEGEVIGLSVESYLLEKSRVVHQQEGERNFHIFYDLCAAAANDSQEDCLSLLQLTQSSSYRYLRNTTTVNGSVDNFNSVQTSMKCLGFSMEEINTLWRVLAGIIHLGQVEFTTGDDSTSCDSSRVSNYNVLTVSAELLGVNASDFEQALCTNVLEIRNERQVVSHSPVKASESADSLAKNLYERVFDWVVHRTNKSESSDRSGHNNDQSSSSIGILDIFGFEVFESNNNCLEQLCINFTNEHLQRQFNTNTFIEEEKVYQNEEIAFEHITFIDNQSVVDLIEGTPYGLMHLLDEQSKIPGGYDAAFVKNAGEKHESDVITVSSSSPTENSLFTILHYAGKVSYTSNGIVEKNKDSLLRSIYDLMSSSKCDLISITLFPLRKDKSKPLRTQTTLTSEFRSKVSEFITALSLTESRYIRCIKPNDKSSPSDFVTSRVYNQLRSCGVFENIAIRKNGFPFRLLHSDFINRYKCISTSHTITNSSSSHRECEELLKNVGIGESSEGIQIGRTMVLYRGNHHKLLEAARNIVFHFYAPRCQALMKGVLTRKFYQRLKIADTYANVVVSDHQSCKTTTLSAVETVMSHVTSELGSYESMFEFKTRSMIALGGIHTQLLVTRDLKKSLEILLDNEVDLVHEKLAAAIERSYEIDGFLDNPEHAALIATAKDKLKNCAAAQIQPQAYSALDTLSRNAMLQVEALADALNFSSPLVQKIKQLLELPEEAFVKLQLRRAVLQKDERRKTERSLRLKEIYLESNGWMFELERYPFLRTEKEFNRLNCRRRDHYRNRIRRTDKEVVAGRGGMLSFSSTKIYTSLVSALSPSSIRDATRCFQCILDYTGVSKLLIPHCTNTAATRKLYYLSIAQELMKIGLNNPTVRVEIFLQLFKQLGESSKVVGSDAVWELIMLATSVFSPPNNFELFFVKFIRSCITKPLQQRNMIINTMYKLLYYNVDEKESVIDLGDTVSITTIDCIVSKFKEAGTAATAAVVKKKPVKNINNTRELNASASSSSLPGQSQVPSTTTSTIKTLSASSSSSSDASLPSQSQVPSTTNSTTTSAAVKKVTLGRPETHTDDSESDNNEKTNNIRDKEEGQQHHPVGKVLHKFSQKTDDTMLQVKKGQVVTILDSNNKDWWLVSSGTKEGWVPATYVKITTS